MKQNQNLQWKYLDFFRLCFHHCTTFFVTKFKKAQKNSLLHKDYQAVLVPPKTQSVSFLSDLYRKELAFSEKLAQT